MTTPIPVIVRGLKSIINISSKDQLIFDDPTIPGIYYITVSTEKSVINSIIVLVDSNNVHLIYHTDSKNPYSGKFPLCLRYDDCCEYKNYKITYRYTKQRIYVSSNIEIKNVSFNTILTTLQGSSGTTPVMLVADYLIASNEKKSITIVSPVSLMNGESSSNETKTKITSTQCSPIVTSLAENGFGSDNNVRTEFMPSITSITPAAGSPGTQVSIIGKNFTKNPTTSVTFGQNLAQNVNVTSSTTLTCILPSLNNGKNKVVINNALFLDSPLLEY
jgi:hypothetical protein